MKKPATRSMTKAGRQILHAMQEVLDGEVIRYPEERDKVDIKYIRNTLGMSRDQFAAAFHFSKYSVRNWELGKRTPSGATYTLLQLIAVDPLDAYRKLHV